MVLGSSALGWSGVVHTVPSCSRCVALSSGFSTLLCSLWAQVGYMPPSVSPCLRGHQELDMM